MPDVVAHYAISYIISSRYEEPKKALIIALAGLVPDVYALFLSYRWITHSLLVTIPVFIGIYIILVPLGGNRLIPLLAGLYELHLFLDLFTSPTPLLWPLSNMSYFIKLGFNVKIMKESIRPLFYFSFQAIPINFSYHEFIEGPLLSEEGILFLIAALATSLRDIRIRKRRSPFV